jgi:hypothetical protein
MRILITAQQCNMSSICLSAIHIYMVKYIGHSTDDVYIRRYNLYTRNIKIFVFKMLKIGSILRLIAVILNVLWPIVGVNSYNVKYK